jgi:hypothetical protein
MGAKKKPRPRLTCVDSCADANPEEAEYVGPETLTRFIGVVVRQRHRADFGVGRPVVDETCSLARHVGPFTILHSARFVALDKLREAVHQCLVEGVVLLMAFNDGSQDFD